MQNMYTLLNDKPCDLLLHYQRDSYRRRLNVLYQEMVKCTAIL